MSLSNRLALPFIDAAQSQKHVTHNEALVALDALVHLSVKARNMSAPPASAAEGDRYLVGAGATGTFVGKENAVAAFDDGGWAFLSPRAGWRTFVEGENLMLLYDGAGWTDFAQSFSALQNMSLLGIGSIANASNPLSAKLNAALFTAKSTGEGGTGDLRFTLNKSASGNTASQLYETNYSGRAETGLTGDDHFHVKVSADGTTWKEAINIDPATGAVSMPNTTAGGAAAPAGSNGDLQTKSGSAFGSITPGAGVAAALAVATNAANGLLKLDGSGKVATAQLPSSVLGDMQYQGGWNASTNSPAIPTAAAGNKGWYYVVTTAGSTNVSGVTDWKVSDWLVSNGASWDKIDNTDAGGGGLAVLQNYMTGFIVANDTGSPLTKIDVASGQCADSANAVMITGAAGTIDCATVGVNGMDTGSLPTSGTVHFFVIAKADGTTNYLALISTTPALPTGYTVYRRVASMLTDASAHIRAFLQIGDKFALMAAINAFAGTVPSINALYALNVPTGIRVMPFGDWGTTTSNAGLKMFDGDSAGFAPSYYMTTDPGNSIAGGVNYPAVYPTVWTNTSGQVRVRCYATTTVLYMRDNGWIDERGRKG